MFGRLTLLLGLLGLCWQGGGKALGGEPPVLDGRDGRPLALELFRPKPMLKVPAHHPAHARLPVVDVHLHPRIRLHHDLDQLDDYVKLMDQHQIAVSVSLDGQLGDELQEHQRYLWTRYRDRFVIFANLDWQGSAEADHPESWACNQPDFGRRMATELAQAKEQGASGLKIFKELGLGYRNVDGTLIRVDDARWDPIWQACGELGLPVLIHTGDPAAFFEPIDETNERWEELERHPNWSFAREGYPTYRDVLSQLIAVVARHPRTTFLAAHCANCAEDLGQLGEWLDKYPNLNVDLAARIGELGRQPRTAEAFFRRYSTRILFGTDGPRTHERLLAHWRFLETADEYFPYAETPFPPQGFWNIYGLDLPDDILRQIYSENACRLIPGVREKLSNWSQKNHRE